MLGIIYKATNKVTDLSYIGQTTQNFEIRIKSHFSEARRSKFYFHKALIKYGESNFTWEIIEGCDSKEELDEMEFHYIKQYSTLRPGGYNLTLGGDGILGYKASDATKKKLSSIRKGRKMSEEARLKLIANHADFSGENNPMYGITSPMKNKHHTKETRSKISKKLTGKRFSEEHKRKLSESAKYRWRLIKNGK